MSNATAKDACIASRKKPSDASLRFTDRRRKIEYLKEIAPEWGSFAKCFTSGFLRLDADEIEKYKISEADPKDLLEVLLHCSLFDKTYYDAGFEIKEHCNNCYGHLPVLLIDSKVLPGLVSTITELADLLVTEQRIDDDDRTCS